MINITVIKILLNFFSSAGPWETAISPVHSYLAALSKAWSRGDATEHTHRAALQKLFENSVSGLEATNEPKASQPENKPDFLLRKSNSPIGYAEAKDLRAALPAVLRSAQIRRYQEALPNLLVTNYLDFVWLVGPDKRMEISLGRVHINATQYFDGVLARTWVLKVGGYKVCEKWLKDRKGRPLSLQDLDQYRSTVAALTHTRTLMDQIEAGAVGALWPTRQ